MKTTVKRYSFIPRDATMSAGFAAVFWIIIVGTATLTTHSFSWSLAAILGLAMLPVGVAGGIRERRP